MIKHKSGLTIFAIAFCGDCGLYTPLFNERSLPMDAQRKLDIHAGIEHESKQTGMGWTKDEGDMIKIRRNQGFKEGNL